MCQCERGFPSMNKQKKNNEKVTMSTDTLNHKC